MISRETIDDVKSRMDIVDVIGDFVSLKRSGQNYKALSPFTNEKTASFYVVPAKGIFKDFSSGKGGDAITFVMEHESMSYTEAIRYLAKKYGVDIKEDAGREELTTQSERDSLYIVMNYAKEYYKDLLLSSEEGRSIGLSYFRERGFNDRTIEKFELGYTLNEWDHLYKAARSKGYSEEILEKSGLLIVKKEEGKKYDRFRGRVIFPVHNLAGKVIAFGARILTKEKDQPKYINSPETEIYHKSNVLYGLYQGKNAIRKEEFCYLVEGYTDVLSLHQADIENVVASSGTALTEEQIKLMRRFTENVTVLYDGDAAGIKAALRGIDLVLKGGLNVRIVLLPDGEDPDSFSRKKGSTELKQYLKSNTQDFISFKIGLYSKDAGHDPIKKAEAIREIVTSIGVIPDPIKRSVYIQETSHLLKISESVLFTELNKLLIQDREKKTKDKHKEGETKEPPLPVFEDAEPAKHDILGLIQLQEKEAIRLLLNYADSNYEDQRLLDFMLTELEEVEFTNPVYNEIYQTFRKATEENEVIDTLYFMEHCSEDAKRVVAALTTFRYEASKHWGERYHIHVPQEKDVVQTAAYTNVLRLKFRLIQKLIEENLQEMKQASNEDDLEKYFTIHEQLKGAEKEIAGILGIVVSK
ncbi:DNA primase [Chryseosolibacter indicus]|uniref:DNA primase n=1 Tax=Chryseosolibacter indicus TaxID=2782351 RepID=A0ABS5VXQ1_9BACT|nr:DNA primase [Chryseosolibacter indicus]MBT1706172.1 DNA primase [Chryseosolibacter indicus]